MTEVSVKEKSEAKIVTPRNQLLAHDNPRFESPKFLELTSARRELLPIPRSALLETSLLFSEAQMDGTVKLPLKSHWC